MCFPMIEIPDYQIICPIETKFFNNKCYFNCIDQPLC